MNLTAPALQAALLLLLVAAASSYPDNQDNPLILCEKNGDCMGKNAKCYSGRCKCPPGYSTVSGDCFRRKKPKKDGGLRNRRSPGSKVEKLEKKLAKAHLKEAKKHGAVVVPVAHVPVAHVPVTHVLHSPVAHVPVVHVSRHRRAPGAVSKLERKIVKAQAKRIVKKEGKKVLKTSRHRRDSHKKIEKLERKLVKEQIKQAKKDAKKGRVGYVAAPHYYHPQPVHYVQPVHAHKKPKGIVARAKSYIG